MAKQAQVIGDPLARRCASGKAVPLGNRISRGLFGGNPGFDAIVGNPPFLGGRRISTQLGGSYRDWLGALHVSSHGNADLVAHFFRRSFALLRSGAVFGMISTNTIAQEIAGNRALHSYYPLTD